MKDKRAIPGRWLRRLENWWFLFKGDVEQIVWCEAPSVDAWRAMIEIVEAFEDVIDAEEEGTLSADHPQGGLAWSLRQLSEYLYGISNGPLLETRLGRRLFEASKARRFRIEMSRATEEGAR